ncbi:hypothetical protein [Streptomyces microflavus]|uniref:hypothetical protein n=1 Tax=Streptomyces microflavus TaxID=1919 RepID=UPI00369C3BD2
MTAQKSLEEAISSGDRRKQLEALRDYVAHELEANRCKSCQMSMLRTGDTASLVLRLQKICEELAEMPEENKEASRLELIRGSASSRTPNAAHSAPPPISWKSGA